VLSVICFSDAGNGKDFSLLKLQTDGVSTAQFEHSGLNPGGVYVVMLSYKNPVTANDYCNYKPGADAGIGLEVS